MSPIRSASLPDDSLLHPWIEKGDFLDCFAVDSGLSPRQAAEIIVDFPAWARGLLWLRHRLTAPFGLLQQGPPAADMLGIFPVDQENDQEVTAGFNDRHLNFRVSVYAQRGRVFLATWVRPHNFGGRLYLNAILPFHVMIARNGLARVRAASKS